MKRLEKRQLRLKRFNDAAICSNENIDTKKNATRVKTTCKKNMSTNNTNLSAINQQQTVLIVEDSITARTMLEYVLVAAGYQVKTANDGLEGQQVLDSYKVDIVLSDIDMPRVDGWALINYIRSREHLQHLPVVLLSGLQTAEDRQRGIAAGVNDYLIKENFRQKDLLTVVRRLI
ncbi:response regulator [Sporomusa aerivorans]|uniref:response regulator n=1 Tax=Sporomusa aerivorans TaxID=204936 RepID=UPI00352A1914